MTIDNTSSNSFWEDSIYASGKQLNLYPYDSVVSFVYRSYPTEKPRNEVSILEIGCGAGNNLWFIAREGFNAVGIDISPTAISIAKERFNNENLEADLRIGSFFKLPWGDETMDMCIDRCSTACVGLSDQLRAIQEVKRVLKPGGLFFFNGYSNEHTSAKHGNQWEDGRIGNIKKGTLQGVDGIGFLSRRFTNLLFEDGWEVVEMQEKNLVDLLQAEKSTHSELLLILRKL